jgi:DNA sulfur modification protein DndD
MKYLSLKMSNWRSFYGAPIELTFATEAENNVTIIHGDNGSGKTALMNAFNWVLTGKLSPQLNKPDQLINKQAIVETDVGEVVEAHVECRFTHKDTSYRATRRIKAKRKDTIDETWQSANNNPALELMFLDDTGNWLKADGNAQAKIDSILPPAISDFFLFDGENVKDKFYQENQSALANQMRHFFGLDSYLSAAKVLGQAARVFGKEAADQGDEALSNLLVQKEDLDASQLQLNADLEKLEQTIGFAQRQKTLVEKELKQNEHARSHQDKREKLNKELQDRDRLLKAIQTKSAKLIAKQSYVVFIDVAIEQLQGQIAELARRGQLPSDVQQPFVQKLLDDNTCICTRSLESGSEERDAVENLLLQSGLSDVEERVLRMQGRFQQLKLERGQFWDQFDDYHERYATNKKDREDIVLELRNISRILTADASVNIQQLELKREQCEIKIRDAHESQGQTKEKIKHQEIEIHKIQSQIATHETRNQAADLARKYQVRASEAQNCIEKMYKLRDLTVRQDLHNRMQDNYKRLTVKEYLPTLSDKYRLEIKEPAGGELTDAAASSGEMQILALCFIGSIIEIQKERSEGTDFELNVGEYPIVLDSPYGVLGHNYRLKICQYMPEIAQQLICMVSDSQFQTVAKDAMLDRVGKAYLLVQHSQHIGSAEKKLGYVELNDEKYSFFERTELDYDWTTIVELPNA